MDGERFDALARLLAGAGSRRRALGALGAGLAGLIGLAGGAAGAGGGNGNGAIVGGGGRRKKRRDRDDDRDRRKRRRRKRGDGPTPDPCAGRPNGTVCGERSSQPGDVYRCCRGSCYRNPGCIPTGEECADPDACLANCCSQNTNFACEGPEGPCVCGAGDPIDSCETDLDCITDTETPGEGYIQQCRCGTCCGVTGSQCGGISGDPECCSEVCIEGPDVCQ